MGVRETAKLGKPGGTSNPDIPIITKTAKWVYFGAIETVVIGASSVGSSVENGLVLDDLQNSAKVYVASYRVRWKGDSSGSWEYRCRSNDDGTIVNETLSEGEYEQAPTDEFKSTLYPVGVLFQAQDNNQFYIGNVLGVSGFNIRIEHELTYSYQDLPA